MLGDYAYGYARSERGGHRLVRISPFDGQARRHTSFARVEVMPVVEQDVDIIIDEKDVEMDASGRPAPAGSTSTRRRRPSA